MTDFSKSKKWILPSVAVLLVSFQLSIAGAAIEETLNLPAQNRAQILRSASAATYSQLREVAFSGRHSMSLRWKAVMGMAEARKEKALPDLMLAAEEKDWFMRNAALVALTHAQPNQALRVARRLMQDPALVVRSAAVEVLALDLNQENRDLLWESLESKINFKRSQSLWIRPQIVEALASAPKAHERLLFARLLNEEDVKIQENAIKGLERLTGKTLGQGSMPRKELVALWKRQIGPQ